MLHNSTVDPAHLTETLAEELNKLTSAVQLIQTAQEAATQAADAASQIVRESQIQRQQQEAQFSDLTQMLSQVSGQLEELRPILDTLIAQSSSARNDETLSQALAPDWVKASAVLTAGICSWKILALLFQAKGKK